MNKKDVLKALDISAFVAVIVASVMVLIFEFSGSSLLIFYALAFYTAGFLLASIFFGVRAHDIFKKKNMASTAEEHSESDVQIVDEISQTKSQRIGVIVKLVLSLVAFIFTLVVLILY